MRRSDTAAGATLRGEVTLPSLTGTVRGTVTGGASAWPDVTGRLGTPVLGVTYSVGR